jgi:hypothetical protein
MPPCPPLELTQMTEPALVRSSLGSLVLANARLASQLASLGRQAFRLPRQPT